VQTTQDKQYQQKAIGFFLYGFSVDYRMWQNKIYVMDENSNRW